MRERTRVWVTVDSRRRVGDSCVFRLLHGRDAVEDNTQLELGVVSRRQRLTAVVRHSVAEMRLRRRLTVLLRDSLHQLTLCANDQRTNRLRVAPSARTKHLSQSGCSGLAVACLTAVREVPGSNHAVGSCVHRTITAIYSLGHGLYVCTFPAVPRLTQPSTLRGTVNEYQLSGWVIIIKWRWWL